jgi:hypothetical protein
MPMEETGPYMQIADGPTAFSRQTTLTQREPQGHACLGTGPRVRLVIGKPTH